jgi:phospholipid/cholesterol/gamma-HCH transport system substrate-binding protein
VLRGLPALTQAALPSVDHGKAALAGGRPVIDQLRPYAPDLVSLWSNVALGTSNYDANGHYARAAPQFGAFREAKGDSGETVLEPIAPSERTLAPQTGLLRRCPGSASQATPDGSAPLASLPGQAPLSCDPDQVPAGP